MNASNSGHVLVAGGTGLIGKRLCSLLTAKGYDVRILSRQKKAGGQFISYSWDPSKKKIDPAAMEGALAVINLAGAGIADHSWSVHYKKEIVQSRVDAAGIFMETLRDHAGVKCYMAASAIGYYGDRPGEILSEESRKGSGFLSDTTQQWELASENCPVRRVIVRTGIVLSKQGGALPPLARSVKAMLAPVIYGKQIMSWIHIDDLCNIYIDALENEKHSGIINAVAHSSCSHEEFILTLKRCLNPSAIRINVPQGFIKLLMGERSHLILDSADVKPAHLLTTGFHWKYDQLNEAINNLYVF